MSTLEMQYSNDRAAYTNDANHYNGRNGYHQTTGTQYSNGRPQWQYNYSNDKYTYYKGDK